MEYYTRPSLLRMKFITRPSRLVMELDCKANKTNILVVMVEYDNRSIREY